MKRFALPSPLVLIALLLVMGGSILHFERGFTNPTRALHAFGADDAYVSFRYARHLQAGDGLVYNPGDPERVEGYTNLLYTLAIAVGFFAVPPEQIYIFATGFNIVCTAISVLLIFQAVNWRAPGYGGLAALIFAACPLVWLWTASGMETALVLMLQIGFIAALDRSVEQAGDRPLWMTAALLIIARADGFLLPLVGVVFLLLRGKTRSGLSLLLVTGLTLAALTIWRMAYYGDPLPNTFYAKVAGDTISRVAYGIATLATIIPRDGLGLALIVLIAGLIGWLARLIRQPGQAARTIPFEVLFGVLWLGYWLYVGGDVYLDRFLLVLVPLAILLAVRTMSHQRRLGLALLVCLTAVQFSAYLIDVRFDYRAEKYDAWVTLGQFLGSRSPDTLLAVDAAGKIPYFSDLATIDMLGWNDRTIARTPPSANVTGHARYNPVYVLSRQPDLIAAWIDSDLNVAYGLTRERYETAGYRVRYLVYVDVPLPEGSDAIIDVAGWDEAALRARIEAHYNYAVLEHSF
ncbi:MAG: hypothetical protein U0670_04505 [Anaerolineae bacterium]